MIAQRRDMDIGAQNHCSGLFVDDHASCTVWLYQQRSSSATNSVGLALKLFRHFTLTSAEFSACANGSAAGKVVIDGRADAGRGFKIRFFQLQFDDVSDRNGGRSPFERHAVRDTAGCRMVYGG